MLEFAAAADLIVVLSLWAREEGRTPQRSIAGNTRPFSSSQARLDKCNKKVCTGNAVVTGSYAG
jgi:hypothetical protein